MGRCNGKQPISQLPGCHDLNTVDGEFVLEGTAIGYVVYSIQTGVRFNRDHCIK